MESNLLVSASIIPDVLFFLLLLGGIGFGAYRGFIKSICEKAGSILSIIIAVTCCIAFAGFLENTFGFMTMISDLIANSISKKELYAVEIPAGVAGAEIKTVLESMGIGWFDRLILSISFKNVEIVPEGATAATMLAATYARWLTIAFSFVFLALLVKLLALIISNILTKVTNAFTSLRFINQGLGGLLGLFEACILIFFLLTICRMLPFEAIQTFISSSKIVGAIYNSQWFYDAVAYVLSGQWFNDYIKGYLIQ